VSKVLLENEASRFAAEHGISLVTVCPVITVGAAPAPKVRTSIIDSLSMLSGESVVRDPAAGVNRLDSPLC
jgi:anthocyanidin reductase